MYSTVLLARNDARGGKLSWRTRSGDRELAALQAGSGACPRGGLGGGDGDSSPSREGSRKPRHPNAHTRPALAARRRPCNGRWRPCGGGPRLVPKIRGGRDPIWPPRDTLPASLGLRPLDLQRVTLPIQDNVLKPMCAISVHAAAIAPPLGLCSGNPLADAASAGRRHVTAGKAAICTFPIRATEGACPRPLSSRSVDQRAHPTRAALMVATVGRRWPHVWMAVVLSVQPFLAQRFALPRKSRQLWAYARVVRGPRLGGLDRARRCGAQLWPSSLHGCGPPAPAATPLESHDRPPAAQVLI